MTYEEIVRGLRDSNIELQEEGRLVRAGLKTEQDTAAIMERYAWLYSDEALEVVSRAEETAPEAEREPRRRVRIAVMFGIVERRIAPEEDRLTTHYATSRVRLGDEEVPFFTAQSDITRDPDPRRREALGEGSAEVEEKAEDLSLEVTAKVMEVIRGFGYDSYTGFWGSLKGVDYDRLRAEVDRLAESTWPGYRAWVEPRMVAAGHTFGTCPQWHLGYFRGLPEHDPAFTRERFEPAMRATFERIGLDVFDLPSVNLDLEDRPSKNPRASVWVPEAGVSVHLLTRPTGGSHDYAAFLHEAGHALHFGLTDPAIGWPLANLGRSMAYAELWSFLFEHIGHDPRWISEATGVGAAEAERISADMAGVDLMMFMRYRGKLTYELDLYAGDVLDRERGRRLYSERMSALTAFRYDPRPWRFDQDPGFYSADYLRAWLAYAAVQDRLREMFGDRWWASREAGAWLRSRWSLGSGPEAEETVEAVGGRPWSGDALARVYAERLEPISG